MPSASSLGDGGDRDLQPRDARGQLGGPAARRPGRPDENRRSQSPPAAGPVWLYVDGGLPAAGVKTI